MATLKQQISKSRNLLAYVLICLASNRSAELEAVRQIIGIWSINDRFAGQN